MSITFADRSARVVIVEESGSLRQLLSGAVRGLGFREVLVIASGRDVLGVLEAEQVDWLIMPLLAQQPVNSLHLLNIIADHPQLRRVRVSLLCDGGDEPYIDVAFALGALSCHPKANTYDAAQAEFRRLMEIAEGAGWRGVLTAAEFLRDRLRRSKRFQTLVQVERRLLDLHPATPTLMLKLGEAQILAGETKDGVTTVRRAGVLDEAAGERGEEMLQKLLGTMVKDSPTDASGNILGLECCVIIDPDSAVLSTAHSLLTRAGVPQIQLFDDGEAAWNWLETHDEPSLILQEWRLPRLNGPMLLQRIRHHGFVNCALIVASSAIKPTDAPLLRELGVDNVVPKPFGQQLFFKNIVWTIQQLQVPTEQKALERKMRQLLAQSKIGEAERLRLGYAADPRIQAASKKHIDADFALHHGRYREARDLAIEALRLQGDSLLLLGLIGKCLLKLGDFASASRFFEKAHGLSPLNLTHLCDMASSQFEAGNHDKAASLLASARKLDAGSRLVGELECQHAIIDGQVERARALIGAFSAERIVGYMNNRAVALTRCGRYDDGIKVYHQTVEALPEPWGDVHDVVAYNLGLAYARFGELDHAQAHLQPVVVRDKSPLRRRALSLSRRIEQALDSGQALPLDQPASEAQAETQVDEEQAAASASMAEVLEVRRGDVCLRGIYEQDPGEQVKKLLASPPVFKGRAGALATGRNS